MLTSESLALHVNGQQRPQSITVKNVRSMLAGSFSGIVHKNEEDWIGNDTLLRKCPGLFICVFVTSAGSFCLFY